MKHDQKVVQLFDTGSNQGRKYPEPIQEFPKITVSTVVIAVLSAALVVVISMWRNS